MLSACLVPGGGGYRLGRAEVNSSAPVIKVDPTAGGVQLALIRRGGGTAMGCICSRCVRVSWSVGGVLLADYVSGVNSHGVRRYSSQQFLDHVNVKRARCPLRKLCCCCK